MLLARAFRRARGADANAEIDRVRKEGLEGGVERTSYEILLPDSEPIRYLVETVLPKLVYFLDCRGEQLPRAPRVFASMFLGDALYCLHAEDLIDELARLSGLSTEQMVMRWGAASV